MKIDKQDFEKMKSKYSQEVGKGKPGKNKKGDITTQTKWIFFDRESIERVLAQADPDPKKGGIKFYFTEYTQDTAEKYHPGEGEKYDGLMTLVFEASSLNTLYSEGEGDLENIGKTCPPTCEN
jgi:hypothetical protein